MMVKRPSGQPGLGRLGPTQDAEQSGGFEEVSCRCNIGHAERTAIVLE
jgi:hypothetical protein